MTDVPNQPVLEGGPLALVIMNLIEENQERWDQGSWRIDHGADRGEYCTNPTTAIEAFVDDPFNPACTTAFCYAGWIGAYDRVKWVPASTQFIGNPALCDCTTHCCTVEDHQVDISVYAGARLGIGYSEATALFRGDNTLDALWAGTEAIINGFDVEEAVCDVMDGEPEDEYDDDDDEPEYADVEDEDEDQPVMVTVELPGVTE